MPSVNILAAITAARPLILSPVLRVARYSPICQSDTMIAQLQSCQTSGFSVWIGPEIRAADGDARLFLSEYLTKCPVKLSCITIERKDGADVVRYSSDKGVKEFTPLDFMAALSARHAGSMQIILPDMFEHPPSPLLTQRATEDRNHPLLRSIFPKEPCQAETSSAEIGGTSPALPEKHLPSKKKISKSCAKLIKKIHECRPTTLPKVRLGNEVLGLHHQTLRSCQNHG